MHIFLETDTPAQIDYYKKLKQQYEDRRDIEEDDIEFQNTRDVPTVVKFTTNKESRHLQTLKYLFAKHMKHSC